MTAAVDRKKKAKLKSSEKSDMKKEQEEDI